MTATQKADMERLALAVRRARLHARKDEPLPVTEEERLMDSWDDEPLFFHEMGDADAD